MQNSLIQYFSDSVTLMGNRTQYTVVHLLVRYILLNIFGEIPLAAAGGPIL